MPIPDHTPKTATTLYGGDDLYSVDVDSKGALKVSSQPPTPPDGTTPFTLAVPEATLEITATGNPHVTLGAIVDDGVDVHIQTISSGSQGDVSENGSVVEVYWREGSPSTDHLFTRMYIQGATVYVIFPDANEARDGTLMSGDGVTTRLVVHRRRLSQAGQEVDFEIRGYTE